MSEPVVFERLQTQKNYMQIARQIRNMIREGKLNVGDRLPAERDLVQQFGASRASIREALSALEMLGLIECRGGQGNFIKADGKDGTIDGELLKTLLQDHDPYEIFEARLEIEPRSAGPGRGARDRGRAPEALRAGREAAGAGSPHPRGVGQGIPRSRSTWRRTASSTSRSAAAPTTTCSSRCSRASTS